MKVLVVEDSKEVVEAVELCCTIRWPDAEVVSTDRGLAVASLVETESPDIVILDLGLPDVDGLDVLQNLRKTSDVPVIILTARAGDSSRVKGLELGGDDNVVKPFSPAELLARMNAVLPRRAAAAHSGKVVAQDGLHIDIGSQRVRIDGKDVSLTPAEWNLLAYLATNQGKIISNTELAEAVLGSSYIEDSAIRMCVRRLRIKLNGDPRAPRLLHSHRGLGYSFELAS
jgi:two-component system KDP operon response regulator KdpE